MRSPSRTGVDAERPSSCRHAIREVGEAGSAHHGGRIEARPVVLDAEADTPVRHAEPDRDGRSVAGVLGGVLEALETAEVDGVLDSLGVAADPGVVDADGDRRAARHPGEREGDPALREGLRVDAARHGAQLVDRRVDLGAEALEHRPLLGSVDLLPRERQVDPQRHEPLLGAVVQVALDPPPLGMPGLQDAGLGGAQLSLEVAVLHRQQRRGRRGVHQLGILGERLVDHHRRHVVAAPVDRQPRGTRRGRRRHQLLPSGSRNRSVAGS